MRDQTSATPFVTAGSEVDGVRVLIVDDTPGFRVVAREVVALTSGFTTCGEAESGHEALMLNQRPRPHMVLMDLRMPEMDGIETTRAILEATPSVVVVLLTADHPATLPPEAWRSGARAVAGKNQLRPSRLQSWWDDRDRSPRSDSASPTA